MSDPIAGLAVLEAVVTPSIVDDDDSAGSVAWSDPSNATHPTDYASVLLPAGAESHNLHGHSCDWSAVPPGARIVGATIDYERVALLGLLASTRAQLVRAGGPPGLLDQLDVIWLLTVGAFVFGTTDADWGQTIHNENVRDDAFGMKIRVQNNAPLLSTTFRIRAVTITVSYQMGQTSTGVVG